MPQSKVDFVIDTKLTNQVSKEIYLSMIRKFQERGLKDWNLVAHVNHVITDIYKKWEAHKRNEGIMSVEIEEEQA